MDFAEQIESSLTKFALNVTYYRKLKKLNQDELALKSHLSRNAISKIEASGIDANPTLSTMVSLSLALEIPLTKLLEFRD